MAEQDPDLLGTGGIPDEEGAMEAAPPRRAASAEFDVDADVGSEAAMRRAMDPANQSLREALRLSYRVLQLVMMVLVVVFVFSGVQQVQVDQTGVMLRWGRIVGDEGEQSLEPGAQFNWFPYPAGEFVLFKAANRWIDLGGAFWPMLRPNQSFEEAVESATIHEFLRPGRDGVLLTRGGDIAHLRLRGLYEIDAPVAYVRTVANEARSDEPGALDADRLVDLALRRAAVHAATQYDVDRFVEFGAEQQTAILRRAQEVIDVAGAGIRIVRIETPVDPTPALAVRRAARDVQEASRGVELSVKNAEDAAQKALIEAAGPRYDVILDAIERYEVAIDLGRQEEADELLVGINELLEDDRSVGTISQAIQLAKSNSAFIETTLGHAARRFARTLPQYRENPDLVVQRLWAAAYANVVTRSDTHLVLVPDGIGRFRMQLASPDEIAERRRQKRLDRKEMESRTGSFDPMKQYQRARDMQLQGPGRMLGRDAQVPE